MERGWQCSNLKRSTNSSNFYQVPVVVVRVVRSYVSWLNSNQAQFQFWDLCFVKSDNLLSTYFEKLPVIKQWFQLYKCLCKSNFKSGSILNSVVMVPKSDTMIFLVANKCIEKTTWTTFRRHRKWLLDRIAESRPFEKSRSLEWSPGLGGRDTTGAVFIGIPGYLQWPRTSLSPAQESEGHRRRVPQEEIFPVPVQLQWYHK